MNKAFLLAVILCLSICCIYAQTRQVNGKVTDAASGEPLIGANVSIKGTKQGVATNLDGKFTLPISQTTPVILVFKYVGYTPLEINLGEQTSVNVKLRPGSQQLEEVVAIGYATVNRRDLTGSVSSVNEGQLRDVPVNSAEQALTGRLAGVQITASEGSPDAEVKITVRGGGSITQDNSPLYIIDGIQVEDGLSSISPQDIERIDVLKDASATAVYGARGANGVILVTTKSGKTGKPRVTYNGFFGTSRLAKKLDVMSPYEYLVFQYERSRGNVEDMANFAGKYGTYSDLEKYRTEEGIDWQGLVLGNKAGSQTHNISVNGGSKIIKYNFSYANNQQEGTVVNTDYDRHLFNFKTDYTGNSKLKGGVSMRYADIKALGAGTSDPGMANLNGLRSVVKYRPLNVNGLDNDELDQEYFEETNIGNGLGIINPLLSNYAQYRNKNTTITNLGANVSYKFNKSWSFKSTVGINYNKADNQSFDDTLSAKSRQQGGSQPMAGVATLKTTTLNQANVLTYTNKSFLNKKASLTVIGGQEIYTSHTKGLNSQLRYFPVGISARDALNDFSSGSYLPSYPIPSDYRSTLLSLFTRANYSYNSKYLAAVTLRADGSSKFAEGNKWGYFPSASFAWRLSEEEFFKDNANIISDLKVRISYGETGNNRIADYQYQTSFTPTSVYIFNDGTANTGYEPLYLANSNLKWEATVSKNIGLDIGLFKNKLQITLDAYHNQTNNVLIKSPISLTSGYVTQLQNIGATLNKGIETQLTASIISKKSFTWTSNFNISFNRNTVKKIAEGQQSYLQNSGWGISGQPADYIVQTGKPVGSIYGYVSDGFYTTDDFNYNASTGVYTLKEGVADPSVVVGVAQPGLVKLKDTDGDGVIGEGDKRIIGNANPKFFGGLNQQLTWKNFDASVFVNFQYGNDVLNANKIEFTNAYAPNTNMLAIMNDRWRTVDGTGKELQWVTNGVSYGEAPELLAANNQGAKRSMPLRGGVSYYPVSSAVEDASFLRINNVTLGYTFKLSVLRKAHINNLRVYATASNVALFTNYSGYDPEVNTRRATPVTPGVDYAAYPRSRSYLFGINLSL